MKLRAGLKQISFAATVSLMQVGWAAPMIPYVADTTQMAAFKADNSAPCATSHTQPLTPNDRPCSVHTAQRWQTYNRPLQACVQGNTIIPSNGQDMLAYLFSNQIAANVNMAILGWQHKQCRINFSEGPVVKYCAFNRAGLSNLLQQVLNDRQFDANSQFAQLLATACQATPIIN